MSTEMFNMQTIGVKISTLRKNKNMTQANLADHMGVSFQAVSNWERGISMPDIAKLGELSKLFEVSIDEILNNNHASIIVHKVIDNQPLESLETEELLELAPITEPQKIDNAFAKKKITAPELAAAAPFLSRQTIGKLFEDFIAEGEANLFEIMAIAPFVGKEGIDKALKKCNLDTIDNIGIICGIAPFASRDIIDELLERISTDEIADNSSAAVALAPFASRSGATKIAMAIIKKHGIEAALPLLPFVDKKQLDTIFE